MTLLTTWTKCEQLVLENPAYGCTAQFEDTRGLREGDMVVCWDGSAMEIRLLAQFQPNIHTYPLSLSSGGSPGFINKQPSDRCMLRNVMIKVTHMKWTVHSMHDRKLHSLTLQDIRWPLTTAVLHFKSKMILSYQVWFLFLGLVFKKVIKYGCVALLLIWWL